NYFANSGALCTDCAASENTAIFQHQNSGTLILTIEKTGGTLKTQANSPE
ncbi:MAG: hypothetical protein ACI82Z_000049, partial [Cellvibrionaceae bacterium]